MGTDREASQGLLESTRSALHRRCVVCGEDHAAGLRVDFRVAGEAAVEATFACDPAYEGYANVLHGGIVSALLDGAMANALLARGIEAYTVDLRLRFRGPVEIGVPASVRGEWLRQEGPLHLLQASITQDGRLRATARAKFMEGSPALPARGLPAGAATRDLVKQSRLRLR